MPYAGVNEMAVGEFEPFSLFIECLKSQGRLDEAVATATHALNNVETFHKI